MTDLALIKLQTLLRTLFQFDSADLNFGIYRVLNYKRAEIEAFIETRLPQIADEAFARYAAADRSKLEARLQELRQSLTGGLDEAGNLKAPFDQLDLGKEYLEVQRQVAALSVADELKVRVYNDLYTFFSRYYEDGDFISKRRRGREETYAVPYNGEEVLLHWANKDQYYIKTDERLAAYRFHTGEFHVAFEVRAAETTANNNKSDSRFYVLAPDPVSWDADARLLTVGFQHRALTESEAITFGKTGQQDKINGQAADTVLTAVSDTTLKGLLGRVPQGSDRSSLLKHLGQFTRRNTLDFFIHKDLKGFLTHELDHFIKTEALRLDDLLADDADALPTQVQRARATRHVALSLIELLAQVEDFQKRLFEKKKFVLRTDYCLTLDRVPEGLWPILSENVEQLRDWEALYGLKGLVTDDGAPSGSANPDFLRDHQLYVVDTAYFSESFKWELLGGIEGVEDALNGVLLKSENYQALSLLQSKYRQAIRCTYIDPPFNTENDQFLYKDNYRDSCWMTLMENRVRVASELMSDDGTIYVHLDHNSHYYMRLILNSLFGQDNFMNEIIWRIGWLSGYKTQSKSYVRNHETLLLYGKSSDPFFNKDKAKIPYMSFEPTRTAEEITKIKAEWGLEDDNIASMKLIFYGQDGIIYKTGIAEKSGRYYMEDTWNSNDYERLDSNKIKRNVAEYTPNGSALTQKPEQLLERVIECSSNPGDIVLDFHAGSGTTPAVAMKLGRKFIAVEVGDYFESDLLWRMKQVLSGKRVGISRRVTYSGSGMFKYHKLEQYEDTLNNLEVSRRSVEGKQAALKFADEYLLRYMLDFETQGSPSLLDLDALADPFDYTLSVLQGDEIRPHAVDLVETFNYLLGLTVIRLRAFQDGGRDYRAVLGEKGGRRVAVVWRKASDLAATEEALARDRTFITDTLLPSLLGDGVTQDRLYVNGPCAVAGAEAVEPEFKRLMFGEAL